MTHPIPPEVLAQHTAILGKTGSGKTSTSKLCVEQVVAGGFRVCILDTIKSDWWGITSSADGKKPGLPFKILGGPHGHVPLHSSAGKAIGQLVGEGKLPLSIIDMANFEPGGVQKFFSDFAPALMSHAKGVLYLVIEEAHEVCPKERAGFGAENMAIHYAKKLATAGRSKGIRLIVATQRIQSLHNAVLGSCDTLIAHRLTAPADQGPIKTWLKSNADKQTAARVESSMSSLPTGTGWLCSGEARIFEKIVFRKFATYDNAKTPTGDDEARNIKTAPVDAAELRSIIGDAVAEAEANDPKRLKAKVAELTKQLAGKAPTPAVATAAPEPAVLRAAEDRGRSAGFDEGRRVGFAEGEKAALKKAQSALGAIQADEPTLAALPPRAAVAPVPARPISQPSLAPRKASTSGIAMPKAERLVLTALAQYPSGRTKVQIAILTGYASSGGGFNNALSALRSRGWIGGHGTLSITNAGIDALGTYDPLPSGRALLEHWLGQLSKAERGALEALANAYPSTMTKEEVAAAAGYEAKGGGFNNALSRLRTLELISGRGELKASDDLFDEAA